MTEYSDEDAQGIAERGRDELVERLRPAFHETVRQHADILELDDAQIEEMIQRAAERADGMQWRRALAAIATEQLGMSLGEALRAPVVARAQQLAGAPSYEEAPGSADADADADADATQPETLRLTAKHLGGIAALEAGEQNLELRIGAHGLDISRRPGRVLGRLGWSEIRALETQPSPGLRRRQRRAHLVIRTQHGDATFEVEQVTEEDLQASLAPVLERYARR